MMTFRGEEHALRRFEPLRAGSFVRSYRRRDGGIHAAVGDLFPSPNCGRPIALSGKLDKRAVPGAGTLSAARLLGDGSLVGLFRDDDFSDGKPLAHRFSVTCLSHLGQPCVGGAAYPEELEKLWNVCGLIPSDDRLPGRLVGGNVGHNRVDTGDRSDLTPALRSTDRGVRGAAFPAPRG